MAAVGGKVEVGSWFEMTKKINYDVSRPLARFRQRYGGIAVGV
jgi:hypothetical protein